jgi:intein-encoded DNA endonuclease-like protein
VVGDPAWWNLDMYLADVIAHNLRDYARNSSTFPSNYSQQEWKSKLNSIAERLEIYYIRRFQENEEQRTNDAKAALRELADIFPYLWD